MHVEGRVRETVSPVLSSVDPDLSAMWSAQDGPRSSRTDRPCVYRPLRQCLVNDHARGDAASDPVGAPEGQGSRSMGQEAESLSPYRLP